MFFQTKACANNSLFSNSKANNNELRWPRNIKRSSKQSLGDLFLFFPLTLETISGVTKEGINLLNLELNRKWKGMLKFLLNVQVFKRVIFEGKNKKANLASVFFFHPRPSFALWQEYLFYARFFRAVRSNRCQKPNARFVFMRGKKLVQRPRIFPNSMTPHKKAKWNLFREKSVDSLSLPEFSFYFSWKTYVANCHIEHFKLEIKLAESTT